MIVIQLFGEKAWKVYKTPPIAHPYEHEQVGKNGMSCPLEIFDTIVIDKMLQPGDVLYMPRGYVHEASCPDGESLHVTIAIPTQEFSFARVFEEMARELIYEGAAGERLMVGKGGDVGRLVSGLGERQFDTGHLYFARFLF